LSVSRQVNILFQTEFSKECDVELPPSTSSYIVYENSHYIQRGENVATFFLYPESWLYIHYIQCGGKAAIFFMTAGLGGVTIIPIVGGISLHMSIPWKRVMVA
jgi:hypothetical protein